MLAVAAATMVSAACFDLVVFDMFTVLPCVSGTRIQEERNFDRLTCLILNCRYPPWFNLQEVSTLAKMFKGRVTNLELSNN